MDPKTNETKEVKMTKADAAKLVHREVPVLDDKNQPKLDKDKNVIMKQQAIKEDEVMNFAEYPDRVVVVTTAGEKLTHVKKA